MAGQVVGMGPRIGGLLMGPGKHAFFKSGIARPEGPKVTRKFARGFCARTRLTILGGGGGVASLEEFCRSVEVWIEVWIGARARIGKIESAQGDCASIGRTMYPPLQ